MTRITSSSNRSKRKTKKVVTTSKGRANRSQVSKAQVTSASNGKPSGAGSAKVTTGRGGGSSMAADARQWQKYQSSAKKALSPARSAPGTRQAPGNAQTSPRRAASQVASARMRQTLRNASAARAANANRAIAVRGGAAGAVAAEVLRARPTATGTLTDAKARAAKGGKDLQRRKPTPQESASYRSQEQTARAKNASRKTSSFDDAFRSARKAGVKSFTWRGKKYTTEIK